MYIQINVELDLKDGETLCKLKITKPSFTPSWCMKSCLQLDTKLVYWSQPRLGNDPDYR